MDLDYIRTLAASGESEMLEFKRSTGQRSDAVKAACAMLNNRGGRILIGVEPDGSVVGQEIGDQTLEQLVQELQLIDPPAFPSIERVPVSTGREVIVVSVTGGRSRPYTIRGRAYRRVGSTNHELSRDEYNALLLERLHGEQRWEIEPATSFTLADLDESEILVTVEEAIRRGRLEDPGTRDPAALLQGLGLIRAGSFCAPPSSCSGALSGSRSTIRSAYSRSRGSGESIARSFSTTGSFAATSSTCCAGPSVSCSNRSPSRGTSSRDKWRASTSRCIRRWRFARRSRTPSAIGSTRGPRVPSPWGSTTIG